MVLSAVSVVNEVSLYVVKLTKFRIEQLTFSDIAIKMCFR